MDNLEGILQCLNEFEQTANKSLTPELEQLLEHIAKTGRTVFPWNLLKPLISFKLEKVLNDFFESNSSGNPYTSEPTTKSQDFLPTADKLISNLNCFTGTPFTIQRICELITQPRKHYNSSDKFLRGVEKNIMVVSTVQPDGSLITRSLNTVLTNGSLSPNESETTDATTLAPVNSSSHNSPLNTSLQENSSSTTLPLVTSIPAEEKPQTLRSEDNDVGISSAHVNGSLKEDEVETKSVQNDSGECSDSGKTESCVALDEKAVALSTTCTGDSSQEHVNVCPEKQPSESEIEEKPTDEKPESLNDEKMDES